MNPAQPGEAKPWSTVSESPACLLPGVDCHGAEYQPAQSGNCPRNFIRKDRLAAIAALRNGMGIMPNHQTRHPGHPCDLHVSMKQACQLPSCTTLRESTIRPCENVSIRDWQTASELPRNSGNRYTVPETHGPRNPPELPVPGNPEFGIPPPKPLPGTPKIDISSPELPCQVAADPCPARGTGCQTIRTISRMISSSWTTDRLPPAGRLATCPCS